MIYTALHALDERSRRVIEARYLHRNADGVAKPVTLQELADELGVSAERVRQIESAAIRKLRSPDFQERLRDYLQVANSLD